MSVIGVSHWARRDSADRGMLGQTAWEVCKALRAAERVEDARFYWSGPDTVVIQVTAGEAGTLLEPPSNDAARALFDLADLADRQRFEQWIDPRTGMSQYEMAGR